jgi:hypothetical protein
VVTLDDGKRSRRFGGTPAVPPVSSVPNPRTPAGERPARRRHRPSGLLRRLRGRRRQLLTLARQLAVVVASALALAAIAVTDPDWLPWVAGGLGLVAAGVVLRPWVGHRLADAADADTMLAGLRERVLAGAVPAGLPAGWSLDTDLRCAHNGRFSGDFIVTSASAPARLEVVLVDVSGSGPEAGARAMMLAGAFEALLDAVPSSEFLPVANRHVLGHDHEEGFATAIQVSLDLETGDFALTGAGHPPAVHYRSGSGRWDVLHAPDPNPALGLLATTGYSALPGRLAPGDALLLYTDGLVESRRIDVERGIDRLVGHADALLPKGISGAAARISEAIRAEDGDDRALVVIHRNQP